MIQKVRYMVGRKTFKPIFVIGTGRSGTHWIGYSIAEHPEIHATIEAEPMFQWSTTMALNPQSEQQLLPKLIKIYKQKILKYAPQHYLDKNHPNIWIAEKLKRAFPNALFIGIERNPFATVASMIKHKGVSAWHYRWHEFPIPNRFLGINDETAASYDQIPFPSKCAMRWVAHHNRMNELMGFLKDSLLVISYESLALNTQKEIRRLQSFLTLSNPIPIPNVRSESLDKWREQLSEEQITHISAVVGYTPDEYNP